MIQIVICLLILFKIIIISILSIIAKRKYNIMKKFITLIPPKYAANSKYLISKFEKILKFNE